MKKLLCTLICLALLLGLLPAALAIEPGVYPWRKGVVIILTEVMEVENSQVYGIKEGERGVGLMMKLPKEIKGNEETYKLFMGDIELLGPEGQAYTCKGARFLSKGDVLLFAVPAHLDLADLKLSLRNEQADAELLAFFAGDWAGQADRGISLSFHIEADGTGSYTFQQAGYKESYSLRLDVYDQRFAVEIPRDNQLSITSIEGDWVFFQGVLTLDVVTSFANGQQFTYSIPCKRANLQKSADGLDLQLLGSWRVKDPDVELIIEFKADGSLLMRLQIPTESQTQEKSAFWRVQDGLLIMKEDGQSKEEAQYYNVSGQKLVVANENGEVLFSATRVEGEQSPASAIPAEYIGKWQGKEGDITLTFVLSEDSRASFTFEQGRYKGSQEGAIRVTGNQFELEIPADDPMTQSCGGSYAFQDGVLTLAVLVQFKDGSSFSYTVPCTRVEE